MPNTEAPENVPSSLGTLFSSLVREVSARGRSQVGRGLHRTRDRLALRQLQRDRELFLVRLGKTALRLTEGGELSHPALHKAIARIHELEAEITRAQRGDHPDVLADGHDSGR